MKSLAFIFEQPSYMVSMTPASRYNTSASRYHPLYQSRHSIYIRGLIQYNFAKLAEAVQIGLSVADKTFMVISDVNSIC